MYAHRDAGGPMPGAAAAAAIPEREVPGPGSTPGAGPGAVPVPEDGAAFAAIYQRYRPQLIAYCRRRLREDWREAEDAAHEALLRAYCALPSLDASTDAWPWLATIAARVCADVRRRNARVVAVPASVVEVGGAGAIGAVGLVARTDDVHEQVARRLRADIVEGALGRLPARYRTSLFLKEFAGWTCGEIAHIQGTSVAAVRSVLVRGRRRLGTGVEELARSRGQWPLPTVVPTVAARARARLREWREAFTKSGQVLLAALDPMGLVGGLLLGGQAAMATGVVAAVALVPGGHAAGTVGVVAAPASAEVRAPGPRPGPADPLARTGAQAVEDLGDGYVNLWYAPRETLARVDSPQPPLPTGSPRRPPVHAEAAVESRDEAIWARARADLWVTGNHYEPGAEGNLACGPPPQRRVCAQVREALRLLPGP